jgi:hypothetical protein
MTDEEIEQLCEACAAGPWQWEDHMLSVATGDLSGAAVLEDTSLVANEGERAFIAAARTLVPELLAAKRAAIARAEQAEKERDEARSRLRAYGAVEAIGAHPIALQVCSACGDTHTRFIGEWGPVMCTLCPVPCEKCRRKKPGDIPSAYCVSTPCSCACHRKAAAP